MKRFVLIMLIVSLTTILGSCEIKKPNEDDAEQTTLGTSENPQPFPVIIGNVEIEKTPEKVVCLSPSLTEILYEQGYGSTIIGRGSYCDYPPAVKEFPDMGSSANPDIESILQLKPEIVLTASPIAEKDLLYLEQNGIKTLCVPSPDDLAEFLNVYQAIGLMFEGIFTGKEKGEAAFSEISKACDNKEVVNLGNYIYITENLSVATGDTLENSVFSCFGSNLAMDYEGYEFDIESLLENQPDIILINDKYTLEDLENSEVFSQLDALKSNMVIFIDNSYFERPTSRITEMLEKFKADYRKLK